MKKVAIVADGWRKLINYAWIGGCRKYITEHHADIELYIFHSFGNSSKDEKYNHGEYNIINLPDFREFDGIILEMTNVGVPQIKQELIRKALDSGVPVISLIEEIPGAYFAGIDNRKAMRTLVEHVINEHGCRSLNYVGGPIDNNENALRMEAFSETAKAHGIPAGEERVFCRDYEIETGERAFDHFLEKDLIPDAFICANDNIAVGICHRAKEKGFHVPEDFLVTGFDNFDKASYYSPRITTAGFIREEISYKAMQLMCDVWENKNTSDSVYADVTCFFQESCGCKVENPPDRGQYVINRIFGDVRDDQMQESMLQLKRDLINCNTFAEMGQNLTNSLEGINCHEVYILVNHELIESEEILKIEPDMDRNYITEGYPDEMDVILAFRDGEIKENCIRNAGELIPCKTKDASGDVYLFSPLHFRDREVGYMVFKNCDYLMDTQLIYEIISTFQDSMENLYNRMILHKMNEELSMLYVMDSLTGLYNRMAYNRIALPLFESCMRRKKPILIMFLDLDRLKYVNDTFGHDMGNIAIKTIAGTIRQCCPQDAVAMRYGGDEFVVLIPGYGQKQGEHLVKEIHSMLERTSKSLQLGFDVECSSGFVVADNPDIPMSEYINQADEMMYEQKKAKKVQRQ